MSLLEEKINREDVMKPLAAMIFSMLYVSITMFSKDETTGIIFSTAALVMLGIAFVELAK